MSPKNPKRPVVPALLTLLLAVAPAAHAASARGRAPGGLSAARNGALSWLAAAWHRLTGAWEEEGSEIDPNGKPAQRTLGVEPGGGETSPQGSPPDPEQGGSSRRSDEGSEIDPNG